MIKKKDIKSFFSAIRKHDNLKVQIMLDSNPDIVNVRTFAPPKKDDGQSPLQVAFKCGNFEIADILINNNADVNFVEQSGINEWNMPVLHDAIRAAIFSARTVINPENTQYQQAMLL